MWIVYLKELNIKICKNVQITLHMSSDECSIKTKYVYTNLFMQSIEHTKHWNMWENKFKATVWIVVKNVTKHSVLVFT